MRKALVVLLAIFVITAAAWAQVDTLLGPHNTNQAYGCQSCHTPHSAKLAGQGLYLWALDTPTTTYTTYGVGTQGATSTLTPTLASGVTPDTQVHTVLCLSCHDGSFNSAMYAAVGAAGTLTNPGPNGYSTSTPIAVGAPSALKAGHSEMATVSGSVVKGTNDLTSNHPVHVVYPNGSTNNGIYDNPTIFSFWKVSVAAGNASFVDNGSVYNYGHAVRLFGTAGGDAYVECGSCHNPHAQSTTLVKVAGVNSIVNTAHFLRGQYKTAADISGFCMSCHADKSAAWTGTGAQ